jgi:Zn-dependent protease
MFTNNILFLAITLITSLTVHEAAHAFTAYKLGDPTAKNQGRLTLNPLKHLDPWGTLFFILVQFGWGKPVPVNPVNFKNPKRDQALTALAGPTSNIIMAFIAALFLVYAPQTSAFFGMFMQINIILAVFNLIPIPPLDGSQILGILLNDNQYIRYQQFISQYSAYLVIALFIDLTILPEIIGFSILGTIIQIIAGLIQSIILLGTI